MNRRQRIIVSVTGIFLVLLILVGLTYAYFLTQIDGNENTKSISVSTANLALVYGDGNGIITAEQIQPGTTLDTKTFTVKNEGNAETDYVVLIDDVKVTYAENVNEQVAGETTTFESNDFIYTLTCTSDGEVCNGIDTETIFPINNGILVGNSVEVGKTHTYSLKVTYKETGIDQSNDMNKTLEAKVNIKDVNDISVNPYSVNKNTLAYNIINNSLVLTEDEKSNGYATYAMITPTKIAKEFSDEKESVLSTSEDDYGISYYYRGAVKNNYLEFNNMCWRIVRIEGDGSVKITLAAPKKCIEVANTDTGTAFIGTGDYGANGTKADYENSTNTYSMKKQFDNWFNTNFTNVSDKLKGKNICIGDISKAYNSEGILMTNEELQNAITSYQTFYYRNYIRVINEKTATYKCIECANKTNLTKIFPLTVDEVLYAGGYAGDNNNIKTTYYLNENASSNYWWTISIAGTIGGSYDNAFSVVGSGNLQAGEWEMVSHEVFSLRPALSLIAGTKIANGDGSISNPYTIE